MEWWHFSSQVTITRAEALLSWGMAEHGKHSIPCSALIACVAFAFPIELSLSQPISFLSFALLTLSPIPLVRQWVRDCVVAGWA